LHGSVSSFYFKQFAKALVARVDGVCLVDLEFEVSRPTPGDTMRLALRGT
jgi:hypothetical protein